MAHLVRDTFPRRHARLESIRLDSAPAPDRLRRGLRAYIEFGLQHPHHYMVLFMKPENFDGNEKIKEAFQTEGMQTFGCLEAICAECIQLGCLRPEVADHRELAQSLWMGIHGFVSAQIGCAGFPFLERNRLIDRLLDILLTGIVRKP
jgi:AcrR family transcriptional regulator